MTPSELWDIFETTYGGDNEFYDDESDLDYPTYGQLKRSYTGVIDYWLNTDTVGGKNLIDCNHLDAVPVHIIDMVNLYHTRVEDAKQCIAKEVFNL